MEEAKKTISVRIDTETHRILSDLAKQDKRALGNYIALELEKIAKTKTGETKK